MFPGLLTRIPNVVFQGLGREVLPGLSLGFFTESIFLRSCVVPL